jgi:hypothetical protein
MKKTHIHSISISEMKDMKSDVLQAIKAFNYRLNT